MTLLLQAGREALKIVVLGGLLGLLFNGGLAIEGLETERNLSATQAQLVGFSRGGGDLFIDLRAAEEFRTGHVPGALSLPGSEWPEAFVRLADFIPRHTQLVLCGASAQPQQISNAQDWLQRLGYVNRTVMFGGFQPAAWRRAGGRVAPGAASPVRPPRVPGSNDGG